MFANECIPVGDRAKYNIEEIDRKFVIGATKSRQWTIDRDRDIYLRCVVRGRDDISHLSTWTLFWGGELIIVELEMIKATGSKGGACSCHQKITNLQLPEHLIAAQRDRHRPQGGFD